jgi:hypothetical protein
VLEVYTRPHDAQRPLICLDEADPTLGREASATLGRDPSDTPAGAGSAGEGGLRVSEERHHEPVHAVRPALGLEEREGDGPTDEGRSSRRKRTA